MAASRRRKSGGIGATALLTILASFGADKVNPKKPAAPLPEVIRNDESDDVNGKHRPDSAASKRKGPATLQSAEIDDLIEKGLVATKTPLAEPTNDEEFIRRVYLDLLGKLPTPGSVRQFAQSRDRDKRARLIDVLLEHPDTGENWARYWRDVIAFRSPNENERQIDYPLFVKWLAGEFAANKPWDQIATAIITANGRNDEKGATVFPQAEEFQPVEMAGEVSRIFLGIQIQCAQCHDHPSDPWKRQQFHEFAAFFSGVKRKPIQKQAAGQRAIFEVVANGATHYSMPDLKNPEKKIPVSPRFFLGDEPKVGEQTAADARLTLAARYVTSPENPWFAKAFINRTWYALMGEGFYNPIDDLGPTRTANAPELLELVADQWRQSGFDIRWLYRTILNTRAYQRASRSTNTAAGRTPFASNVPSRLRADQIFDALVHAFNLTADSGKGGKGMGGAQAKAKGAGKAPLPSAAGPTEEPPGRLAVEHTFGVDPSTSSEDVVGTIPQALYLMNGPIVTRNIQTKPGTMLGELIAAAPSERAAIDALYLKILARHANQKEMTACLHYLNTVGDHREGFEDILWSLINSTEFVSRR